jgi:tetratricopeptide (TPR) repeat protein
MTEERLTELLDEAREMEPCPTQVAFLEEAVRLVDTLNDPDFAYDVRMELIHAATFAGFKEKAMVAYAWCLARYDAAPDNFDLSDLLWRYKWILDQLPSFPQISRAQIERSQNDMERRYREAGYSLRPVHYMRWSNHMHMGDLELARQHHAEWERAIRDELADCRACEINKTVDLLIRLNENEQAIEHARPLFAGRLKCTHVPDETYGLIVRPLLRLGRLDEALEYHRKGYRRLQSNPTYLNAVAEQMLVLVRAGEQAKAVKIFERHLPAAVDTADFWNRFLFYSAATNLFASLADSRRRRKLRIPRWPALDFYRPDDSYDCGEVATWFRGATAQLATRFNERNGNDYFHQWIAENERLAGLAG